MEIADYHPGQVMSANNGLQPVHPGEILRDELEELGMSASALAKALDVPATRISDILRGRRGVTADTALRLAEFFGTSALLWLNLQSMYELRSAEITRGDKIKNSVVKLESGTHHVASHKKSG